MANLELTFVPLSGCHNQIWRLGYDWAEPDLKFTWLASTATLFSELLSVCITLVVLHSRMIITKEKCTLFWTFSRLYQRSSSLLRNKISSIGIPLLEKLQFVEFLYQWKQTPHPMDLSIKTRSGITSLLANKIEHSEVGQAIVDFDAAEKFCVFGATMKAMNFQEVIPSTIFGKFKDHYIILRVDFSSMQGAAEKCQYPELVREQLSIELNLTCCLHHVIGPFASGERMFSVAVHKFGFDGKKCETTNDALHWVFNRKIPLKFRYKGSFPWKTVPTLFIETYAIINTQPSKMQGDYLTMIANPYKEQLFEDFLGG